MILHCSAPNSTTNICWLPGIWGAPPNNWGKWLSTVYAPHGSTTPPSAPGFPNGEPRSSHSIQSETREQNRSLFSLDVARRQDLGEVVVSARYPLQVRILQASCVLN